MAPGRPPALPGMGVGSPRTLTYHADMSTPVHPAHPHGHDHDHDHSHLGEMDVRVRALQTLLVQKGYIDPAALDRIIELYEQEVGPHNGARVVARAWDDPAYRDWLLTDATAAIADMGYSGRQGEHMVVVPNSAEEHNLVVCTLCSCYPWPVLGLPPVWYKSAPYRSKAVIDPRGVLADFGVSLPAEQRIRVWDSTAEMRYLVLPQRPAGTEGWNREQLAELVTRDSMIGTGLALTPQQAADASRAVASTTAQAAAASRPTGGVA
jgi:nitrile hydratase